LDGTDDAENAVREVPAISIAPFWGINEGKSDAREARGADVEDGNPSLGEEKRHA
jgi:hypothetical protein